MAVLSGGEESLWLPADRVDLASEPFAQAKVLLTDCADMIIKSIQQATVGC
jgi:hypothetical protein